MNLNKIHIGLMMVVVLSAGCNSATKGPDWPEPVAATGTILYGGAPLENATVLFIPDDPETKGHGAAGITNEAGEYKLDSQWIGGKTKPGVIPGKYRVNVRRMVKPDGSIWKADPNAQSGPASVGAREEMPREYAMGSKLTAQVPADGGTYDFDLQKKKR